MKTVAVDGVVNSVNRRGVVSWLLKRHYEYSTK